MYNLPERFSAYIGDLADPAFSWDNGNYTHNVPGRISPEFSSGRFAFDRLQQKIATGEYDGKQTDWGGTVARVTKEQLVQFAEGFCYNVEVAEFIATLEDGKLYALVACENY